MGQGEVTKGVIPNYKVYSLYITSCYLEYIWVCFSRAIEENHRLRSYQRPHRAMNCLNSKKYVKRQY